ncbi:divalent cation transporter [Echinicola strongylocentroti]|uniref:Divalent cation transporter n=1 Tax=Echinicola strongylocentroti TaxID=1795355 RepID=A0A2Z4IIK4_9BACT|nr:divalent cation transporter [Echinicola strongylocentroti]AWW30774.1 divalent cation transporter [Echinicola strongylocentroti]
MDTLGKILIYAGFSGITVFIGALLGNAFNNHIKKRVLKYEISHAAIAFGGGIILSAVALVLVPKGLEELNLWPMLLSFGAGSVIFFVIDKYLQQKGGKMAQLLAMLMDFVPESIALGALFASDPSTGTLLAIFIGLQNLPEAFNSFRDMVLSGFTAKKTLMLMFMLSFAGIGGALIGHFFLRDYPDVTAHLMVFASGGILYLIFQDIAPSSKMKHHHWGAIGACVGFMVGMIGEKVI